MPGHRESAARTAEPPSPGSTTALSTRRSIATGASPPSGLSGEAMSLIVKERVAAAGVDPT